MTVLGSLTTRSRRTADRFAGLPIEQAALEFAFAYREIDHAPFITHPIEVGWLLRCDGQPEEVHRRWAASRSTRVQTATTGAELRHRFGVRIARLVETVSDDPSNLD